MTWPKILALCVTILLAAGGIGKFWLESMEARLQSMDQNIISLHDQFAQTTKDTGDLKALLGGQRADLIKDIADTRVIAEQVASKLDTVNYRLADMAENIKTIGADIYEVRAALQPKKQ